MDYLSNKTVKKLLLYFLTNPSREHHLRELAGLLSLDPGNLSRELGKLTQMGLFQTRERGRLKIFSLNTKHPLYKEIRGIILKTQGAEILIRKALETLPGTEKAFLYGSFASRKEDSSSDIDIMIVGKVDSLELASRLRSLEKKLGREIHYRIFDKKDYKQRLKEKDPFLSSVESGKIVPLVEKS